MTHTHNDLPLPSLHLPASSATTLTLAFRRPFPIDGAGIPLIYLYNRHPRIIKSTVWIGLAVYVACMLGASWAQSVDALIVLQGVGPGLAGALRAFPVIRWLPE